MQRILRIISNLNFETSNPNLIEPKIIMNAFKQGRVNLPFFRRIGGGGNCASIALIKAAIGTYGFDCVFKKIEVDNTNELFVIYLRDEDNASYTLSFFDFQFAKSKSSFELFNNDEVSKDVLEFSNFCFAVMAEIRRSAYRINREYRRAINDLNKGEDSRYIHELLGVSVESVVNCTIDNLKSYSNLLLWNDDHAVYFDKGLYDEAWMSEEDGIAPIETLDRLSEIHGDGTRGEDPTGAQILV